MKSPYSFLFIYFLMGRIGTSKLRSSGLVNFLFSQANMKGGSTKQLTVQDMPLPTENGCRCAL